MRIWGNALTLAMCLVACVACGRQSADVPVATSSTPSTAAVQGSTTPTTAPAARLDVGDPPQDVVRADESRRREAYNALAVEVPTFMKVGERGSEGIVMFAGATCAGIDEGHDPDEMVGLLETGSLRGNYTHEQLDRFVTTAVTHLCPEYVDLLD